MGLRKTKVNNNTCKVKFFLQLPFFNFLEKIYERSHLVIIKNKKGAIAPDCYKARASSEL